VVCIELAGTDGACDKIDAETIERE
jgi:hypothetical protein